MLFQFMGTDLNTHEVLNIGNDISYRLKCSILSYFQKTLKQDNENSHICVCDSVSHRNVADRPCRILWPFMLAVVLDIIHRTTQKDTGRLKSFL